MGFQKIRKIRTVIKYLVGQYRHAHCGIQNMYYDLSDMDFFLICYHVCFTPVLLFFACLWAIGFPFLMQVT